MRLVNGLPDMEFHLLGNQVKSGSARLSGRFRATQLRGQLHFLGFPPSLRPRVVEFPNGVFAVNANRPHLSEVFWASRVITMRCIC